MPAGSRTDFLPLAKAEPIRNDSNASVIAYLRTEGCCTDEKFQPGKSGVRTWEQQGRHQGQCRRRGRRCSRCQSCGPAGPGADHGGAAVPLQPMEDHRGAETHLQPMEESMLEQVDIWKEAVTLWEVQDEAESRWGSAAHGERSPCWSTLLLGRTCGPCGGLTSVQLICEDCTPWRSDPQNSNLMKNCCPWDGLTPERCIKDCLL
ncbi:hypothetical protein BTVI_58560 [Pitangus sulphuratus]|nr:hypothetical protein BTVI_58560 [Pitangus sulphuratus]